MTEPQEPRTTPAPSRESLAAELRQGTKDTAVGFLEDLLYGVVTLVVLVALVGGGAALGSASGVGWLVGALIGAVLFGVLAVVVLVKGGINGMRQLRGRR